MKRPTLMRRASIFILSVSLFGSFGGQRQVSTQNVMTLTALPGVPIAQEPHRYLVLQNSS